MFLTISWMEMTMKIPIDVERAVGAMRVARSEQCEEFTRRSVGAVTCSKGCNHCCYWPAPISLLEGADIYIQLKREHRWVKTVQDKISKAADAVTGLSYSVWLHSATPCVFLENGLCSIYDVRPMSCRTALSKGDPFECQPHNLMQARSLYPRTGYLDRFHRAEQAIFKQFNGEWHTMPIPTAVLVAHRICSGEFSLHQSRAATFVEHLGRI